MQLPSGRNGAGGSDFKRGVGQSWLPEATKLDADWQLGGHWQPSNARQNRPKVRAACLASRHAASFNVPVFCWQPSCQFNVEASSDGPDLMAESADSFKNLPTTAR